MTNLTKEEIKLIEEAVKIHNDNNPNNPIRLVLKQSQKSNAFNMVAKMLMLCVMMVFVSCEIPEEYKDEVDAAFKDRVAEEDEVKPFVDSSFKDFMDNEFLNEMFITLKNINEPYDEITIEIEMIDYENLVGHIEDIDCDILGEPNVQGTVDFGIGTCHGVEFHWQGFPTLEGLMYNDTYYELIQ